MKKILFLLLCTVQIYGQTSNGSEQEFDYGIKNNSTQTITTPTYIGTFGTDGTQGKIPSTYIEKTDNKQNSLAIDGTGVKYPTVDAVNAALPTNYAKVVYVNATSPTTATIFDLNNPPVTNDDLLKNDTSNLYIGNDASTWVYNGSTYVTKTVPATSNFNIVGTLTDAGNNKTSDIHRIGGIQTGGYIYSRAEIVSKKGSSDTVNLGSTFRLANSAGTENNTFQLNASNGVDLWNFAGGTWNKRFTFSSIGDLTANSFIKSGGTSSQFLKADGSIDSTVYAPSTGGTGYIQNQNASAQSANMWISGSGKFGTSLTSGGSISANSGYNGTLDFNYNNGITSGLSYYAGGTTLKFNVTNAGAATFASSVTANKNFILNNSETLINGQVINSIKSNVAASSWAEINTYSIPRLSDGQYFANAIRLGFLVPSYYQGNSSLFEAVSIMQGGNVGIGVISPSAKLDVAGTFNATGAATFSSTVTASPATLDTQLATLGQVKDTRPYKVYTALLSQSGTSAPTATVLENTLGGTVVWTRSNIGQYVGTLTGAFTDQKTIIFVNRSNPSATAFDTNMAANVININTIGYTTFSNSAYVDGQTNSASIEIRVYN